ncbi:MAG: hypothetical protein LBE62_10165 [Azonexus sp.]|jgi:hypothetical protein|nr:hypothetical protein [Azonexus sp.]
MKSIQKAIPILLGVAVYISVFNVLNTVVMNGLLYLAKGSNLPYAAMLIYIQSNILWLFKISLGIIIVASILGGYTAAAHSIYRPYFNALMAGFLYVGYQFMLFVSPIQTGDPGAVTYVSWTIIPPFFSIVGANIYKRQQGRKKDG